MQLPGVGSSKKKPKSVNINLIPKDPFFKTPFGKFLQWSLTVGRYIVIFTEIVVILSFVTRFAIDRQITDLNEKINQKKVIIQAYGTLEQDVRLVQEKITHYEDVSTTDNIVDIFPAMTLVTPEGIVLDQLSINQTNVGFSGTANSQTALNILISNIELSPSFDQVSIGSIENSDDKSAGFSFTIQAEFVTPGSNTLIELDDEFDSEL